METYEAYLQQRPVGIRLTRVIVLVDGAWQCFLIFLLDTGQ